MSPYFSSNQPIAADAFEALIEDRILCANDLYDLDGETFLARRGGCIETFDIEAGGTSCL